MKIISDFYDYYDRINAYGVDNSIYYKRIQTNIVIESESKRWTGELMDYTRYSFNYNKTSTIESYKLYTIGFCGKFYPMIHVTYKISSFSETKPDMYFYDVESFYKEISLNGYNPARRQARFKNQLYTFFNKVDRFSKHIEIFHKYKTPLLLIRLIDCGKYNIETNPCLKNVDFFQNN